MPTHQGQGTASLGVSSHARECANRGHTLGARHPLQDVRWFLGPLAPSASASPGASGGAGGRGGVEEGGGRRGPSGGRRGQVAERRQRAVAVELGPGAVDLALPAVSGLAAGARQRAKWGGGIGRSSARGRASTGWRGERREGRVGRKAAWHARVVEADVRDRHASEGLQWRRRPPPGPRWGAPARFRGRERGARIQRFWGVGGDQGAREDRLCSEGGRKVGRGLGPGEGAPAGGWPPQWALAGRRRRPLGGAGGRGWG
mmetsp:Transcript_28438/g.65518  ORF Transcript_28438/g.65518 Transcript_28438/m.65518 type:complete len:259 (-) Transcript_28438:1603-2379(-)